MTTAIPVRVAIAGAAGKMGQEVVRAIATDTGLSVCGLLVRHVGQAEQAPLTGHPAFTDAEELIERVQPDVWLDLTDARSVVANVDYAIEHGVRPVVGATGYTMQDVERWDRQLRDRDLGGITCPNFAIGALLMMRFAEQAARFFQRAEIIELHHDQKRDAPSGTAKRTRDQMANEMSAEIPIHSVRLPGLLAHQEVLFGGVGEVLTIRHDSLSRQSFMPGVITACREVGKLTGMVYGLEHLLW